MPKAPRFALAALLLGCTAMSAHAGWFDSDPKPEAALKDVKANTPAPAANLEDSIRQAQMLRLAGSYPEAIKHLSQLMMVASDDAGVISEYGKTLAAMGRAQDAVNFLTRAQQLQPGDWTVYSAMGVAQDQLGNQKDAQIAYERALTIKPGEPSVLSNYALSRMLAKDPDMARKLAVRAEIAGGASDAKIARNIAMIRSIAPEAPDAASVVNHPAPSPVPRVTAAAPQAPAPRPAAARPPMASNAVPPDNGASVIDVAPQMAQAPQMMPAPQAPENRIVMQRVPVDPLAGPVGPAIVATRAPRALQPQAVKAAIRTEAPKPAANSGVKTAASQAEDLQAKAEAIARQLANKPAAIAQAKVEANKPSAPRVLPPVKAAEAKPAPAAPKVLPPTPVKAADAKPVAQKAAAKPKDAIPGLRLSANAY